MEFLTNQVIFDRVVAHLRKQGKTAWNEEKMQCQYRIDGLSCAVGCLIPDDVYESTFKTREGSTVDDIPAEELELCGISKDRSLRLLGRLQAIHDRYDVDGWEEGWEQCARDFGLVLP